MKALVVYDSQYGNTEQIARAIGNALKSQADATTLRVADVDLDQLTGLTVLVVGSPTQRFRPTQAIKNFIQSIPKNGLGGVKVAAFDTRFPTTEIEKNRVLAFFVRLFGYAARPIADGLQKKGGKLILPPEGFLVGGLEGPLNEGELDRAAEWARGIIG